MRREPEVSELALSWPMQGEEEAVRQERLLQRLQALTRYHQARCSPFAALLRAFPGWESGGLECLPWVSARLFKHLDLRSVPESSIQRQLISSGTSGGVLSRVTLDRETASLQSRILVRTLELVLGRTRRPLWILDRQPSVNGGTLSARGAGALGVSLFGRSLHPLQDVEGQWCEAALDRALAAAENRPLILFGFTFLVWEFLNWLELRGIKLSLPASTVLLHTGGWKKLQDRAVSPERFRERVRQYLGPVAVHNFYGMAEQTGSVFLECEHGRLHCTAYNHLIVRDPWTLQPQAIGERGLIQVLSALPQSYPGHSLLTEDLGVVDVDDGCECGWRGPAFRVLGRVPKTALRGCSNV